ncbi:MAG: hypothetical protein ABL903_15485 [Methylococcales bacterium]
MKRSGLGILMLFFNCILLIACAPSQQTVQPQDTTLIDPDIAIMSGMENNPTSSSPVDAKTMSLEELSNCATKIKNLKSNITQYELAKDQFAKKKAELLKMKRKLDSQRLSVNAKDVKQVTEFNKLLKQQTHAINQFNAGIDAFNHKVSEQNELSDDFNIFCAERSYRKSDLAKLPADLSFAIETKAEQPEKPNIKDGLFTGDASTMGTNPD